MPKKKMAKAAVKKAHAIARKIAKAGGKVRNAYAVGMAVEKRRLAKKKRAKKR